jgi:hypothetical protein
MATTISEGARPGRMVRIQEPKDCHVSWVRLLSAKNNHVVNKSFHGCVKCCQEEM